jgi:biopolymer transport protein ExbD
MNFLEKKRRKVAINITSLIDVVLLLLIFFMLTTTFAEQPGMKLELPKAKSFGTQRIAKLELTIGSQGEMRLNGEDVSMDSMADTITQLLPQLPEKSLILRADKAVTHGTVVSVMDIARSAGVEKIVIAARTR